MTYAELKTMVQTVYGDSIGAGNFIESDSGSPTELAMLFHLIHGRIVGYPRNWLSCKETGNITSTGASSYNLKTLFPDFLSMYQVYNINSNEGHRYFDNADANITTVDGWTIREGLLVFSGTVPPVGTTIKIQYKSQYLVKDSSGNRKRYFTEDDDTSALDEADINVLVMGIGSYVNWKNDEVSSQKRKETKDWFQEAWTNMLLRGEVERPVSSML